MLSVLFILGIVFAVVFIISAVVTVAFDDIGISDIAKHVMVFSLVLAMACFLSYIYFYIKDIDKNIKLENQKQQINCDNCGDELLETDKYCPNCDTSQSFYDKCQYCDNII